MNVRRRPPRPAALRIAALALLLGAAGARADVTLPALFGSHMVLQRDTQVKVWGWASSGEAVTVTFRGQAKHTTAAGDGTWQVTLDPTAAGGPFTLTVTGNTTINLTDVLVGDVWICCGQSNMMMNLAGVNDGPATQADAVNHPNLRLFTVGGPVTSTTPLTDVTGAWSQNGSAPAGSFSAVGYFFGQALDDHFGNVPIGLINNVAIVPAEAWVDPDTLHADPVLDAIFSIAGRSASQSYLARIAPIQPFTIKGVIYYQGEYNAGSGYQFRKLFPALIESWRTTWGQGDFPFLFVQLASYLENRAPGDPMDMPPDAIADASKWAELREAQHMTWDTVNDTGMAVAIDVGEAWDIHPHEKRPVGERLALAARKVAYGETLVYSGPVFRELERRGGDLVLHYDHVGGGLAPAGRMLDGFVVAGPDQQYVDAEAWIDGDTVVVRSPSVPDPVHVRYAWANYPWEPYPVGDPPIPPTNSLYNAEGLPATPFRTFVPGRAYQVDAFTLPFFNPGFETQRDGGAATDADAWVETLGAARSSAQVSEGSWAMAMPQAGKFTVVDLVSSHKYHYDWNSDLFEPARFRPGTAVRYTVDMASGDGSQRKLYANLCVNNTAGGYLYWGGGPVPTLFTASPTFVTRSVSVQMKEWTSMFGDARSIGGRWIDQSSTAGTMYVDAFSDLEVIRPRLGLSDDAPFVFGPVAPNTVVTAPARSIYNDQPATLADERSDTSGVSQVPTVLYGVANLQTGLNWYYEHAFGPTDHVGVKLIGPDAARFQFVTSHPGADNREIKLVGTSGNGLVGGPSPEQEPLTVRFLGAPSEGEYGATVRIVTQAGNKGAVSAGGADEPLEYLFYVDLPVVARVVVDGDGDGMSDAWETTHFGGTNVLNGGATDDWDHDGALNVDEFRAGTVPTDAGSVLLLYVEPVAGTGELELSWEGANNRFYTLQTADAFDTDFPGTAAAYLEGSAGLNTCVVTPPGGGPLFLRLKVE